MRALGIDLGGTTIEVGVLELGTLQLELELDDRTRLGGRPAVATPRGPGDPLEGGDRPAVAGLPGRGDPSSRSSSPGSTVRSGSSTTAGR